MPIREFIKRGPRFLATMALLLATTVLADRPNIVLIISDDQAYRDFGFMGNTRVHTPHLDYLAKQSAFFPNGYVPSSVCSPSLATLLTGRYPHQHGIHFNHPPPGNRAFNQMNDRAEYERVRQRSFKLIQSQDTLPRWLARRGYASLQTGKFWEGHYRNAGFTEGMTVFRPVPAQTFGGNRRLANGVLAAHGNGDWGLKIGRETMQPIFDFVDTHAGKRPFFVWYAPYLPHQPHDSPKKYFDRYRNKPDVPAHFIPYYAAISQFDDTVGELVGYIERKGLIENTLFVFVIDNGWTPSKRRHTSVKNFFHHTKQSKRSPFEDGLRTPILFRWTNHITPARHDLLCSSVDIVSTLLHLTGQASRAEPLPGINLLDATVRKTHADRAVQGAIYPGDASTLGNPARDVAYRWIRQGQYKLIVPHGKAPWGNYLKSPSLFNLKLDPSEQTNLFHEPAHKPIVQSLKQQLDAWWNPNH